MRTLTNVELGYVSGGESPCYALKGNAGCSPSTPGMSAGQIASSASSASIALNAAALNAKSKKTATALTAAALVCDAVAEVAGWFE